MVRHQAEKVGSFILEIACQTNTGSPTCTLMTMCTLMDRRRAIFICQSMK